MNGYGWLAVALVIFSTWSPSRALLCGLIFGGLKILRLYVSIPGVATQIYDMLPLHRYHPGTDYHQYSSE